MLDGILSWFIPYTKQSLCQKSVKKQKRPTHSYVEPELKNSNREGGNKGARQKFPFLPTFSSSTTIDTTMKLKKKTSKVKLFDYIEYYIQNTYSGKKPEAKIGPVSES